MDHDTNQDKTMRDDLVIVDAGDIDDDSVVELRKKIFGENNNTGIQYSNVMQTADFMEKSFSNAGAIEPPLDPFFLSRMVTHSETLPALISSMASNVHGFGYRLDPVINLDSDNGFDVVKTSMIIDRFIDDSIGGDAKIYEPTDDEVNSKIKNLKQRMMIELSVLKRFFANCSINMSWERLCRKLQTDLESVGYFVFEVRRDMRGLPARVQYAQSITFRALPRGEPVTLESKIKKTDISWDIINETYQFRKYVQVYEQKIVYFKEFGDRRVMSSVTGRYYKDEKDFEKNEPGLRPATEVIWRSLDSSESDVYGCIRWSGCVPGVLGSREQAEVNYHFFRSKAIPPMVIMISGGKLKAGASEKLKKIIEKEIKGKNNFYRILIIEAEPFGVQNSAMPGQDKIKIELKPLTDAIFKDALWMQYKNENKMELGQSFRIPPLLRGDSEKLNRATAQVVEKYSERQVFGPEKRDFSWLINNTIVKDLGVTLWKYVLNSPQQNDADAVVEFVTALVESCVTVNEARDILSKHVFEENLPSIDEDWGNMPLKIALAGFGVGNGGESMGDEMKKIAEMYNDFQHNSENESETEKNITISKCDFDSMFSVGSRSVGSEYGA